MQQRHTDPKRYFDEQGRSTTKHIIPFIEQVRQIESHLNVLEIGCGEAGNLQAFLEKGCRCVGVDFSIEKIEKGKEFYKNHPNKELLQLISDDIYKTKEFDNKFDIIILRDVIEHIHNQDKFMKLLKSLMATNGIVFFAFPPWQNPFGGHQQICENKFLSLLPYFHLLPKSLYKFTLKSFGESDAKIISLLEIKETGISIERFERTFKNNGYIQLRKTLFLINPNYEIKFGLKPRKLSPLFAAIPWVRNFLATCGYYVIALDKPEKL
jgi:SAM-dependent methyltransferase